LRKILKKLEIYIFIIFLFLLSSANSVEQASSVMDREISVEKKTREAFSAPLPNLNLKKMRFFTGGRHLFRRSWVTAPGSVKSIDGLGPVFNRSSCSGCHVKDGRGRPPAQGKELKSMVFKLAKIVGQNVYPDPNYGLQLNDKAILGIDYEGKVDISNLDQVVFYENNEKTSLSLPVYNFKNLSFGLFDPKTKISARVAPAVFGLGLIEAISEEDIKINADPNDTNQDGISGKYNIVSDISSNKKIIGRFGWKASRGSLLNQIVSAAHEDIGLSSKYFPYQNCMPIQEKCASSQTGGTTELSDDQIDRLLLYMQTLAAPRQRDSEDKQIKQGEKLFVSIGCSGCHISTFTTGKHGAHDELSFKTIKPYSDFLLHDMGKGLADEVPSFEATGQEWRTAPLWGIGLIKIVNKHTRLLHDGRAKSIEEAILWHGGEAKRSRDLFIKLKAENRKLILRFLNSL
jgi:CxxC motif-containing protein (DUF1111 family)